MTRDWIYRTLLKHPPPGLFENRGEKLTAKYEAYLERIQPANKEEAGILLDVMNELYEDILRDLHRRSVKAYQDEDITDPDDLPLVVKYERGEKNIQNIPHLVADWIGLILYTRKKYF